MRSLIMKRNLEIFILKKADHDNNKGLEISKFKD